VSDSIWTIEQRRKPHGKWRRTDNLTWTKREAERFPKAWTKNEQWRHGDTGYQYRAVEWVRKP
jgi:hypothetical protein